MRKLLLTHYYSLLMMIAFSMSLFSCSADEDLLDDGSRNTSDVAVTSNVSKLGITYAYIDGYVNLNLITSSYTNLQIGVELSMNDKFNNPKQALKKELEGNKLTIVVDTLTAQTKYYYRTFVKVNDLNYYGEKRSFTTKDFSNITSTGSASDITITSAKITAKGDASSIDKENRLSIGIAYSTIKSKLHPDSANIGYDPYYGYTLRGFNVAECSLDSIIKNKSFEKEISRLQTGTTYYYCSYTRAGKKYKFGDIKSFSTKSVSAVQLITGEASDITLKTATIQNSTSISTLYPNGTAIRYGVKYGLSKDTLQYTAYATAIDGETYTVQLRNLSPNKTYYYRAYLEVDGAFLEGEIKSFKTKTDIPTLITCAQAVELTNALENGVTSDETYIVTGYITEVVGSVSRNQQTFWMADTKDGGKVFEAYYANVPTGVSEFKAGMKVKITGNLMKYVNANTGKVTAEMKNATVEILEDGGGDNPTPADTEVTCAEAVQLTNALEDGATSAGTYSVTGYITEVVGYVSRNQQTFWMADAKNGGKLFEAYYAILPEGVTEFKAGMKVKITGNLLKYVKDGKVTPEMKNATVEILESGSDDGGSDSGSGGGGDTPGVEGNSITFSAMNYENAQDFDGQTITVGDATLAWSKGSGSTTPKYYNTGTAMRLYAGNTLTISSSKDIKKIEFTYASGQDSNNRPFYATSSNTTIEPGTYDFNAQVWSGSAKSIVLTYTGNGGHVRLQAITITYTE